jgi:hypothetical protein
MMEKYDTTIALEEGQKACKKEYELSNDRRQGDQKSGGAICVQRFENSLNCAIHGA